MKAEEKTERENEVILGFIEHYFGHLGIEPTDRFFVCETETPDDLKQKHGDTIQAVYDFGKSLACGKI